MKRCFLLAAVLLVILSQQSYADNQYIVRADGGLQSIQNICAQLNCTVIRSLDGSPNQLFLVGASALIDPNTFISTLQTRTGVSNAELDTILSLPIGIAAPIPSWLSDSRLYYFFGNTIWNGYVNQPSTQIIRLNSGRSAFNVSGSGVVAVIDTGVDPNHPALRNVLINGYDFTRNSPGIPNEVLDLIQPASPTVSGVPPVYVNDSTAAVVDQDTAVSLRQYAAFGHGTMVTGIVHMVAPRTLIMPLKAFRADGTGSLSDVIRALYFGVHNGARIFNMSFSTTAYSKELERAVNFAVNNGAVCVASVGNNGQQIPVYPAAFQNVMGIASTNYFDQRSSFSNYGPGLVWVAAPGETIVSTFPFGTYGASSGTSFSTPFVSGVAALFLGLRSNTNQSQAAQAISNARPLTPDLGYGRLDVYQALSALNSLR